MIPVVLEEICKYLSRNPITVARSGEDTRRDSSQTESLVISKIQNAGKWQAISPNIGKGHNRHWYDIQIEGHYLDIKVSECKSADNTNAKKAIYYFLTGQDPAIVSDQRSTFFKKTRENESPNEKRDYYYLVINKQDTNDVFVVSLKTLSHCSPNANNEPFQAVWDKCRCPTPRDWKQARNFLLQTWASSVQQAIAVHQNGMPLAYPEFFDD